MKSIDHNTFDSPGTQSVSKGRTFASRACSIPKNKPNYIEQNRRADSNERKRSGIDVLETVAEKLVTVGVREAFGVILEEFGWGRLFGSKRALANRIVRELTFARISDPLSKWATVREFGKHGISRYRRSGNALPMHGPRRRQEDRGVTRPRRSIRRKIFSKDRADRFFHDITAPRFEGERADGSRIKECCKNVKHHRVQVLFSVLATPEGLHVGYELYPGNTYEGSTLVGTLDALEKRHGDA